VRRWKVLVALAYLAALLAAGTVVLWTRPSRVTKENVERIRSGMSKGEAEAILGPPGDYRTAFGQTAIPTGDGPLHWTSDASLPDHLLRSMEESGWISAEPGRRGIWISDTFAVNVSINDAEQVTSIHGSPRRTTQNGFESLLWRAKRQWHRWFPP
jgi:hypothetical protein